MLFLSTCQDRATEIESSVIASGQMPNIAQDNSGVVHLVYGNGDSILYSYSSNKGQTFSKPALIAVLPKLAASHTRGPSSDGGNKFGQAQKLGSGSWPLNGCPMDGGGLAIDKNGTPETVWNRKGMIYACEPGKEETEIGKGRSCTMESVNGKKVFAWVEDGDVIVRKPQGMKKNLGKGQLPLLRAVNNEHVLCIWENEKHIFKAVLEL